MGRVVARARGGCEKREVAGEEGRGSTSWLHPPPPSLPLPRRITSETISERESRSGLCTVSEELPFPRQSRAGVGSFASAAKKSRKPEPQETGDGGWGWEWGVCRRSDSRALGPPPPPPPAKKNNIGDDIRKRVALRIVYRKRRAPVPTSVACTLCSPPRVGSFAAAAKKSRKPEEPEAHTIRDRGWGGWMRVGSLSMIRLPTSRLPPPPLPPCQPPCQEEEKIRDDSRKESRAQGWAP
jgi:hypothetical protein